MHIQTLAVNKQDDVLVTMFCSVLGGIVISCPICSNFGLFYLEIRCYGSKGYTSSDVMFTAFTHCSLERFEDPG